MSGGEFYTRTVDAQRRASDPDGSAWVSANAGSGKTHVLTQRVIRLLLGRIAPSKILCLTFTKAAAANMSARVFKTLGDWATLDDRALTQAIVETGAERPGQAGLAFARKLFARTIETPGGLKVQTIHAFCERLLHMFPFEANVPAGFRVIEDREASQLLDVARRAVFADAAAEPALAAAIERIALAVGAEPFDDLLTATLKRHADIAAHGGPNSYAAALAARLGLDPGEDEAQIKARMAELRQTRWRAWAEALRQGKDTDKKAATLLTGAAHAGDCELQLSLYLQVFFTEKGEGPPRKTLATKGLADRIPDLAAELYDEQDRLSGLYDRLRAAEAVSGSVALFTLADAVRRHYAGLKNARGWLDFDDLIARVEALFSNSATAWVLYKLDSGIDHILVDEAQDTSRAQWKILAEIAADFFAGAGAQPGARTFFAVGDEKQSIFSFQGAAPHLFEEMRRYFETRHQRAERPFAPVQLHLSFRSAQTVLESVDRVFGVEQVWRGVSVGEAKAPPHVAFHAKMPGVVEIWPPLTPAPAPDPQDWRMPLDAIARTDPAVTLAGRIADLVRQWTSPGSPERVTDRKTGALRPIREGDVLILVRSRGPLFEALTREMLRKGVPSAGADRLTLRDHLAVRDLAAAGRTALNPDDDLALACVLKSPLIGLDDDDLLRLAPGRRGSLSAALAAAPEYALAHALVSAWRQRAPVLAPFDFYARLLGADGGRRALIGRLGREAADAIDEFLARALAFERRDAPSLGGFLAEIESAQSSVKRDMEATGDAVRVMTVHAAKGLEAPIVFLPDTCSAPSGRHDPPWLQIAAPSGGAPLFVWAPSARRDPPAFAEARASAKSAAAGEHRRLLYVAMTRAAERLIVAGFEGAKGRPPDCWHDLISLGFDRQIHEAPAWWNPGETILRLGEGARDAHVAARVEAKTRLALPEWLTRSPPREVAIAPVAPSRLETAPTTALDAARLAQKEDGRLMHLLLQHLPQVGAAARAAAARTFLERRGLAPERRDALAARAVELLGRPELEALFAPGSRAEVSIEGDLADASGRSRPFSGRIDRLAVSGDVVYVADFKLGGEQAAERRLTQLALYRAALAPLFPGLAVRAFLLWIEQGSFSEIEQGRLDAAYADWARGEP